MTAWTTSNQPNRPDWSGHTEHRIADILRPRSRCEPAEDRRPRQHAHGYIRGCLAGSRPLLPPLCRPSAPAVVHYTVALCEDAGTLPEGAAARHNSPTTAPL